MRINVSLKTVRNWTMRNVYDARMATNLTRTTPNVSM
jgi:hypothetical protein